MATIEKNEVKEENVSRETIEDKPVEVELPLNLEEIITLPLPCSVCECESCVLTWLWLCGHTTG